ncbi:tyrosine-type recombinase/integrase [Streptomyces sp. NPDC048272]|uniref:tyrosine-type recombinase/integrase n=1 Tax=Streptomyces sp. NPDC048272 TaxID=3154616 RepID=UPI003428A4BE
MQHSRRTASRKERHRQACSIATRGHPHTASADTRHSYVTHLIEDGADETFVQKQVGHLYKSTTAIYTSVSGDFMNTMMRQYLDVTLKG